MSDARESPPSVKTIRTFRPSWSVGAVEIDAERVVERGPAIGLAAADALDQAGEVALAVAGDADLGVEVDERDVLGLGQRFRNLIAALRASFMSAAMLPLVSSISPRCGAAAAVARRRGREVADVLRLAVLEDRRSRRASGRSRGSPLRSTAYAEIDQVDAGPERRLLRLAASRAPTARPGQCGNDGGRAAWTGEAQASAGLAARPGGRRLGRARRCRSRRVLEGQGMRRASAERLEAPPRPTR